MRYLYPLALLFLIHITAGAQTVTVSGQCISGTYTLNQYPNLVNGKVAYQITGASVAGYTNVTINLYWLDAPNYLWVLDFDGQPYFQNSCAYSAPPSSSDPNCSWVPVSGTTCTGNNPLVISGTGVLAVKLLDFTASKANGQVILNWNTASESNNKLFEIHRSTDGSNWQSIGSVPGNGQTGNVSRYSFTDKSPVNGINYYQLIQKDYDGRSTYSAIVTADIINNNLFQVFGTSSKSTYQLLVNASKPAEISLLDMSGRKLWSMKATKGMYPLSLDAYPRGIYLLQARINNQVITQKLINP